MSSKFSIEIIEAPMTNNKQQTAVNYLLSHIWTTDWVNYTREQKLAVIEKAKEMEKQQIINSFWNGDNTDCTSEQNIKDFGEQYYNETYGGDEQ
jgi:hypothetical protein